MKITEEWRSVLGGFYQASNFGRIRRGTVLTPNNIGLVGRIKKQQTNAWGYSMVNVSINGKARYLFVHRLVAEAFIGPIPRDKEINHIDGIKSNNVPRNLEYVTSAQNKAHAINNGLSIRGHHGRFSEVKS